VHSTPETQLATPETQLATPETQLATSETQLAIPEIQLGHALFSIVEPEPGHARAFNRWYERDHFFAGCMVGAHFFSGRRWVATARLKQLRFPDDNPITPHARGSLLVLYWMLKGRYEQAVDWAVQQVQQLHRQGRMDPRRDNVSTAFHEHRWSVSRDADGVPVELALEHPFPGLAAIMVEHAPGLEPTAFESRCREQLLPSWLGDSAAALAVCLKPQPLPAGAPGNVPRAGQEEEARRYLWLVFLDRDPGDCWTPLLPALDRNLREQELGRVVWAAPFIPTIPGTDTYMDEL